MTGQLTSRSVRLGWGHTWCAAGASGRAWAFELYLRRYMGKWKSERSAVPKTGSRSREATTQARTFALGVSISLARRIGEPLER
jgi:hypothetical protein